MLPPSGDKEGWDFSNWTMTKVHQDKVFFVTQLKTHIFCLMQHISKHDQSFQIKIYLS